MTTVVISSERYRVPGPSCKGSATILRLYQLPASIAIGPDGATTFGNSGLGIIRGPGQVNFDVSIIKNTKLTERQNLQFRTEFFNAFNHANFRAGRRLLFDGKNNVIPTAAQISPPTLSDARQIQFGLRLNW